MWPATKYWKRKGIVKGDNSNLSHEETDFYSDTWASVALII